MDSRPLGDPGDQSFFDPMGKDVAQALNLRAVLLADHDGLIPARPDAMSPAGQALDLEGGVGVDGYYS
jgi:hypothetical protein